MLAIVNSNEKASHKSKKSLRYTQWRKPIVARLSVGDESDSLYKEQSGHVWHAIYVTQELVSDVITQQTRLVGDALAGVNNGWNEAVQQLLSPSPRADTMSSDHVNFMIQQFQPIPTIHQSVDTDSLWPWAVLQYNVIR